MKTRLLASVLVVLAILAVVLPTAPAQAQVIIVVSPFCCDADSVHRCVLENLTPVGNPCFCFQQGWGTVCE